MPVYSVPVTFSADDEIHAKTIAWSIQMFINELLGGAQVDTPAEVIPVEEVLAAIEDIED